MEQETGVITTPKSARATAKKRQNARVKNLEKDVEVICNDAESDTEMLSHECKDFVSTPKARRRTAKETTLLLQTPKSGAAAQSDQLQTPRRSVRKSIKPVQDYEDIVTKKSLRSTKKVEKQASIEEDVEIDDNGKEAPKWTPAKVGRFSQKRKSRKSRKNLGKKQLEDEEPKIQIDVDVLEVIANDEDENKENVEPQELLRNRKSPKDGDSKGSSVRRSQETCVSLSAEKIKGDVKQFEEKSHVLISLPPDEVRNRENNLSQAKPKQEHKKQQTESKELSELGLNPIDMDEPILPSVCIEKCQERDEFKCIDSKTGRNVEEDMISLNASSNMDVNEDLGNREILQNNSGDNVEESFLNKAKDNKTFAECASPQHSFPDEAEGNKTIDKYDEEQKAVNDKSEDNKILLNECVPQNENSNQDKNLIINTSIQNDTKDMNTTLNTSDCIIISPEIETIKPLTEEEKTESSKIEQKLAAPMPSLALSSDEKNEAFKHKADSISLVISDDEEREDIKQKITASLPSLQISDDEEQEAFDGKADEKQSAEIPKILINNILHVSITPQKNSTLKTNVTPTMGSAVTPKRVSKAKSYRFPTPYRSRVPPQNTTNIQGNSKEDGADLSDEDVNGSALPPVILKLTNMEPKDIVLRSIRKRSFSVSNDQPPKKRYHHVTFNSPANQTAVIEDFDLFISKSAKKGHIDVSNVTKRRKRSLSVDESLMLARMKKHQAPLTPNKLKTTPLKLQPRTKIPNFAAIHQRQFNKMENILDHVTRKAERAKMLTTSASKLRGMCAQKHGMSSNNQNVEPSGSAVKAANNAATIHARVGKPKALKKIDLSDNANKPSMPLAIKKIDDNIEEVQEAKSIMINLPNPQLAKNIVIVHPMPSEKKPQNIQAKKINKPAQPIQIPQVKPAFNLSTTIKKQTANSSKLDRTLTMPSSLSSSSLSSSSFMKQTTCVNNTTKASTQSLADKVAMRRQRHMDMYKGRGGDKASRDKNKSIEIIRGVRSNRRFDLQMQHRKNLN